MKEKLQEIINWLNSHYNQESENYSIFTGSKPGVVRYDEHTAISFWGCGAIICFRSLLYFVGEDDGNWYMVEGERENVGLQDRFSIAWANGFAKAMEDLVKYVEENGTAVNFAGTDVVCHYTL